jgi:glycosyltransferase 2 family protein
MRFSLKRTLSIAAGVLIVGAFLFALYSQAGALRDYVWDVAPLYFVAAAVAALSRGPFIVYPWWRIVCSWGYALGWWRGVRIYFHSGLARYIPGQYWYVLGRAYLAESQGIPKTITAASTLVETLLVTGSAGGVAVLGLATTPGWGMGIMALLVLLGLSVPPVLVALTGSPLSARFWNWLLRLVRRGPLPAQLRNTSQSNGMSSSPGGTSQSYGIERVSWAEASRALLGCYANWVLYGLIAVLALAGVSGGAYLAQTPAVIAIFAASVLGAAIVLFVPQGIVVREGILVYLLNALLGVPVPEAIAAAALTRLIAMGAEGLWALAALRMG